MKLDFIWLFLDVRDDELTKWRVEQNRSGERWDPQRYLKRYCHCICDIPHNFSLPPNIGHFVDPFFAICTQLTSTLSNHIIIFSIPVVLVLGFLSSFS